MKGDEQNGQVFTLFILGVPTISYNSMTRMQKLVDKPVAVNEFFKLTY